MTTIVLITLTTALLILIIRALCQRIAIQAREIDLLSDRVALERESAHIAWARAYWLEQAVLNEQSRTSILVEHNMELEARNELLERAARKKLLMWATVQPVLDAPRVMGRKLGEIGMN